MHILHLLNHTYRYNGNVHAAVDLACAQAKAGYKVTVCSSGGSFDNIFLKNGVNILVINRINGIYSALRAVKTINSFCKTSKVDLLHTHMVKTTLMSWPVSKIRRIPLIATVHNEFQKSAILMRFSNRVIAVSGSVYTSMLKRGVPKSRLRAVLNGTIGSARFEKNISDIPILKSPSIVFVGGLHPRKGIHDLLEAFEIVYASNKSPHLYIVGEGPLSEVYKGMADKMNCKNSISFVGAITDPRRYLTGADIFVLPSHADPAPLVIAEAREAGCAIIASRVDGVPELLEDGEAGILIPSRSPDKLAEQILRLVNSPDILFHFKKLSQIKISHLKVDRVLGETMDVYNECL